MIVGLPEASHDSWFSEPMVGFRRVLSLFSIIGSRSF